MARHPWANWRLVAGGALVLGCALPMVGAPAPAAAQEMLEFSRRVLSGQELSDFEGRLGAATTDDERGLIESELDQLVRQRARERGLTPPAGSDLRPTLGAPEQATLGDPVPGSATDPSGPLGRADDTPLGPAGSEGGGGADVGAGSVGGGGVAVGEGPAIGGSEVRRPAGDDAGGIGGVGGLGNTSGSLGGGGSAN